MRYKNTELAMGALLLLGIIFAWQKLKDLPADAKMFPNMVLAVFAVSTIVMIIRALTGASQRAQGEDVENWTFFVNSKRAIGGFALFAGYLLIVETLGYYTASALFIVVAAVFAEYRNWPVLLSATIAFCVFVFLVFSLLFNRPLPEEFFLSDAFVSTQAEGSVHA